MCKENNTLKISITKNITSFSQKFIANKTLLSSSISSGIYTQHNVAPILIRWLYFKQTYTLSFVLSSTFFGGDATVNSLVPSTPWCELRTQFVWKQAQLLQNAINTKPLFWEYIYIMKLCWILLVLSAEGGKRNKEDKVCNLCLFMKDKKTLFFFRKEIDSIRKQRNLAIRAQKKW